MKKRNWAPLLFLLATLLGAGCAPGTAGRPTPTFPPLPFLSPTPSQTALVFRTPTSAISATPSPVLAQAPGRQTQPASGATPAIYSWPTARPTQARRTLAPSTLTPLAPAARLENLSEVMQVGRGTLTTFAYSPDGRWLGLAARGGIFLYDARTLEESLYIPSSEEIARIAIAPDGALLAAADRSSRVNLYETKTGKRVRTLENGLLGLPLELAFAAKGSLLVVGTTSEISLVWEVASGKLAHRWITSGNTAMAVSEDGALMATSNWNGSIYLWLLQDGRSPGRLWRDSEILTMQYAPDGLTLLAGYGDATAVIWRLDGGKILHTLEGHTERVVTAAISPDGRLAATGSWDNTIRLWDMDSGTPLQTLAGHSGRITQVAFTADSRGLASYAEDGRFQLWSLPAGIPTLELPDFAPRGNPLFTPDSETIITGAQDGVLRWWNSADGALRRAKLAQPGGISALQISADGALIATGGTNGALRLWSADDGELIGELPGLESWVNSLAFSPDGRRLAACTAGGTILVVDLASGKAAGSIETGEDAVLRLAFSTDGQVIAAGAMSGSVVLWRLADPIPLRVVRENGPFISALTFSPDGQNLAAGGDEKKIFVWRLAGGTLITTAENKTAEGLAGLAYTPDGQLLAASFWDKTLRLYRSSDGSLARSFNLPFSARQVAISPDGRRLALGLDDGTLRIWAIH